MATLTDAPSFTANEVYDIQSTDAVEGTATGASFGGIGLSNEPHQQLANRTALLNNSRIADEANIAALQAFIAGFTGSMQTNGYLKIPVNDISRGLIEYIFQWGYYALANVKLGNDAQYTLTFPIAFPNAIVVPPLATNVYVSTGGDCTVASVVSYDVAGATFVLDLAGAIFSNGIISTKETTAGFSWLAIGF